MTSTGLKEKRSYNTRGKSLLGLWLAAACVGARLPELCHCRLVRALLGPTAISEKKLLSGMPLDILGITVRLAAEGIHCFPTEDKVKKWRRTVGRALDTGSLQGGEAQKLAGALAWAGQRAFRRLGRAMLRPIIMHQWCAQRVHADLKRACIALRSHTAEINQELRLALQWFAEVLREELDEVQPWSRVRKPPVHLFCDARGEPARIAAVLFRKRLAAGACTKTCSLARFQGR